MKYLLLFLLLGLSYGSQAQGPVTRPMRSATGLAAATLPAQLAQLDLVARQLPDTHATTLDRLAAALAEHARSDEEKARLIFAWIAYHVAYDLAGLHGQAELHVTAEQALTSRLALCQGYADLFTSLATRMQLPAYTVVGYASGAPTRPAASVGGSDRRHAWNVYRTRSGLHLVDTCWGAGTVSEDEQQFTPRFEPFWFNPPPDQAIFLHWPREARWQLLAAPVDSSTFWRWPYVSESWFKLGLTGPRMRQAVTSGKEKLASPPLPRLYATPPEVQLVQVPRYATLVAGQAVTWVFRVGPGIEVGLEAQGWVIPAETHGPYRRLTLTPAASAAPRIVTWHRAEATQLTYLLEYQVAPAVRRAGQPRVVAGDSVTYLRP